MPSQEAIDLSLAMRGHDWWDDLRFPVAADKLYTGAYGALDWLEQRPLSDGGKAFADLHAGRCAAPKIVLLP